MDTDFLLYELKRRWWPLCSPQLDIANLMNSCFSCISQYHLPIRQVTVLLVGLDNAGKTSTVRGLLKAPLEDLSPTEGCVRTQLRVDNFLITVLDVGGAPEARKAWRDHYGEAHGIIFVVDSSDWTRTQEAKEILEELLKHPSVAGKPLLVLANKQDKLNARLGSELIEALSLEKLINQNHSLGHIEPCSALLDARRWSDRKTLRGLRWLLRAVCLDYLELCARVAWDSRQPIGHEEKEKGGKAERGQGNPKEEKIPTSKTERFSKKDLRRKEKKTPKQKPSDKLQPIRNILPKENTINRKLKKRKQVKIIEKVKTQKGNQDRKEEEEEERDTEAEPDQSVHKEDKHSTALLPGDCGKPKRKGKVKEETFCESTENEVSKPRKGKGEKEKKKRTVKVKKKNKINTEEVPAAYSQPVDLSETFDLYRKTILSLEARQDQGN
ncbi:ADP-ribosylation factor-like protein 13B [Megalops cyprinoides]|uniref:ADP-ribosylation factor-like protein 13B n=1 Tax=Megalops cyprinoides TaxID=118141 RepID=UPI0018654046|nr:ADP-ribosylation factor-like protein 13B [Megalops cyprinoides]